MSDVTIGKRRWHPEGHTIYDVSVGGRYVGSVTHPGPWHAYNGKGELVALAARKAEAVDALLAHVRTLHPAEDARRVPGRDEGV